LVFKLVVGRGVDKKVVEEERWKNTGFYYDQMTMAWEEMGCPRSERV
jgi:hypothetical protein